MKVKTETGRIIECYDHEIITVNGAECVIFNDWLDEHHMICRTEKIVSKEIEGWFYAIDMCEGNIGVCYYSSLEKYKNEKFYKCEKPYIKVGNYFADFDGAYDYFVKIVQSELNLEFFEDTDILTYINSLEDSSKRILLQRLFFNAPIKRLAEEEKMTRFKVEQTLEKLAHDLQLQILKNEKGFTEETPIMHLPLAIGVSQKLRRMGIKTLGQLIDTPYEDLYRQRNLGEKNLKSIRDSMNESIKYSVDRKMILKKFMKDNYFSKEEIIKLLNEEDKLK